MIEIEQLASGDVHVDMMQSHAEISVFFMVIRVSFINKDQVTRHIQTDLTELKK